MKYKDTIFSHKNALCLIENIPEYMSLWTDVQNVLDAITDDMIINRYYDRVQQAILNGKKPPTSISADINSLISDLMPSERWEQQVPIFNGTDLWGEPYSPIKGNETRWTLDFASKTIQKEHEAIGIALEVAFNHGEAIAWNLIKPVLASELNHVDKAIQSSLGIVICATNSLTIHGNFDESCGYYEKFLRYLIPMNNMLTTPILIIGIDVDFKIEEFETEDDMLYIHHIRQITKKDASVVELYNTIESLPTRNKRLNIRLKEYAKKLSDFTKKSENLEKEISQCVRKNTRKCATLMEKYETYNTSIVNCTTEIHKIQSILNIENE